MPLEERTRTLCLFFLTPLLGASGLALVVFDKDLYTAAIFAVECLCAGLRDQPKQIGGGVVWSQVGVEDRFGMVFRKIKRTTNFSVAIRRLRYLISVTLP
jgi:hypothetical protein